MGKPAVFSTLINHYQYSYPAWFHFPLLKSDVFSKCCFNFMSSILWLLMGYRSWFASLQDDACKDSACGSGTNQWALSQCYRWPSHTAAFESLPAGLSDKNPIWAPFLSYVTLLQPQSFVRVLYETDKSERTTSATVRQIRVMVLLNVLSGLLFLDLGLSSWQAT